MSKLIRLLFFDINCSRQTICFTLYCFLRVYLYVDGVCVILHIKTTLATLSRNTYGLHHSHSRAGLDRLPSVRVQ